MIREASKCTKPFFDAIIMQGREGRRKNFCRTLQLDRSRRHTPSLHEDETFHGYIQGCTDLFQMYITDVRVYLSNLRYPSTIEKHNSNEKCLSISQQPSDTITNKTERQKIVILNSSLKTNEPI